MPSRLLSRARNRTSMAAVRGRPGPALGLEPLEVRCVPATLSECPDFLPVALETESPAGSGGSTVSAIVDPSQTFLLNSRPGFT